MDQIAQDHQENVTINNGSASKDQTHVVKGKRTKRQRPQSPNPFVITASSSSGEGGFLNRGHEGNFSPSNSLELQGTSTTEEEDMANCLILLAQGQSRESRKQAEDDPGTCKLINSLKFSDTIGPTAGVTKIGYIGYACKTCNRTFPSFQALGGHRASHKKTNKAIVTDDHQKKPLGLSLGSNEVQFKNPNVISSPLPFQLSNRSGLSNNMNSNKSKVHECSVCGAEFTSGQALGGHMRRHRAPIASTNTTLALTPMVSLESEDQQKAKRQRSLLSLDLDLNLPASENENRESEFLLPSKQQQQQPQQQQQSSALVFSASALVDCHY